jgi:hypothetical protein
MGGRSSSVATAASTSCLRPGCAPSLQLGRRLCRYQRRLGLGSAFGMARAIPQRIRGIKRRPMGQSKESYILGRY